MNEYFRKSLPEWGRRLSGARIKQKKNILSILIILMLAVGLFFYLFFTPEVYAQRIFLKKISLAELDPMNKIGLGLNPEDLKCQNLNSACLENNDLDGSKIVELISGHPMEKMIPAILQENKKVAAFLVAIGNKESKWGEYAPQKNGHDCYNYWGYRGSYNQTKSGYSCFDSPEQAVKKVGGRISRLLAQNIDTPAEMVVWKCGSSCRGHNPQDVKKWIADVEYYYQKLN